MMKSCAVLVASMFFPSLAAAQSGVTVTPVDQNGIVGRLSLPPGAGRHPGVLVIGGAEGGVEWSAPWGSALADRGFAVLALAYFGTDPLPARLQSIPLEYFARALELVQRHPRIDPDRIGLIGFSKGAEAALLVAARHPAIRVVVAAAPSHVAWPGITGDPRVEAPSWTNAGAAVPFVPYTPGQTFATSLDAYTQSLDNARAVAAAEIPVERINGPILLVSGTDDRMWPAARMADLVIDRLRRQGFRFQARHLRLDGAGHAVLTSPSIAGTPPARLGGTAEANRRGRVESSRAAIEFLEEALRPR